MRADARVVQEQPADCALPALGPPQLLLAWSIVSCPPALRDACPSTVLTPSATRNAGSAVITGHTPSDIRRSCRCWPLEPADNEWKLAATASPNAPSATASATCSAAATEAFPRRKRSYPM